jgi:hypothetical protein
MPQQTATNRKAMTQGDGPAQKIKAGAGDEDDLQRFRAREMLTAVEMLALNPYDPDSNSLSASKDVELKGSRSLSNSNYSEQSGVEVDAAMETQQRRAQHLRNQSLYVTWTANDIERMAKEVSDETIADVHLSLLGYWICENTAHYEMAKHFIRELSLDQVSQDAALHLALSYLANSCLRVTMSTESEMSLSVIS